MTSEKDDEFHTLTFSQRYGYESLPDPMRLEYIPQKFKQAIYQSIHEAIDKAATDDIEGYPIIRSYFVIDTGIDTIISDYYYDIYERYHDEIVSPSPQMSKNFFKDFLINRQWYEVLTMIEFVLRHQDCPGTLRQGLINAFNETPISYFVDESGEHPTIFPQITRESGDATRKAIQVIQDNDMDGAATHLREAAEHINAGQYADSIADSIHAVESVARVIDPKANKTLGAALDSLEKAGTLKHPALKEALKKLYGYTSDEEGIRHALVFKNTADVGLDEAVFMFGACASFAAYLAQKHRQQAGKR